MNMWHMVTVVSEAVGPAGGTFRSTHLGRLPGKVKGTLPGRARGGPGPGPSPERRLPEAEPSPVRRESVPVWGGLGAS